MLPPFRHCSVGVQNNIENESKKRKWDASAFFGVVTLRCMGLAAEDADVLGCPAGTGCKWSVSPLYK